VETVAAELSRQLDALSGKNSEDQTRRAQLIASVIRRQDDVLETLQKLRPDDTLLHAAHSVLVGDWKNAAAGYSQLIDESKTGDSVAWMAPPALWAYAGDISRHREFCQKMHERFRDSTVPNDTERVLKMMLLVENGPELPPEAVKVFYDSFSGNLSDHNRAWFLATRALLECRKGDYAEAHRQIDDALAIEQKTPNAFVKAAALAVRSLTYARQNEVAKARQHLDEVKQVMSNDLKMSWKEDGRLDESTVLNGVSIEHDKLIPEILRREADKLILGTDDLQRKD
jgi:tetratricopeptide (TPR) repeat protein